tara:strand:- start:18696 stop:18968 length:273 start_codon:yes stop_codon:yes gene_type:complete
VTCGWDIPSQCINKFKISDLNKSEILKSNDKFDDKYPSQCDNCEEFFCKNHSILFSSDDDSMLVCYQCAPEHIQEGTITGSDLVDFLNQI